MRAVPTYIVESYGVESIVPDQRERAKLVAHLGTGIMYVRTTIVPGDQTLLHLFEATSVDALREAVSVAALECDRIVEVFEASPERGEWDSLDRGGGPHPQETGSSLQGPEGEEA